MKATTAITVDSKGNALAESILETVPATNLKQLKKAARKSRESRGESRQQGERRVTYNEMQYQREFEPSAPPKEKSTSNRAVGVSPGPALVRRHFSNASSVPNRPHSFVEKKVVVNETCGVCSHRIKFRKSHYKCRDCAISCHIECKSNVSAQAFDFWR